MAELTFNDLDKDTVTKAYAKWAPVYDMVFGAVFERGRRGRDRGRGADRRPHPGGRSRHRHLAAGLFGPEHACGVDISEPMLMKAKERVTELGLAHVEGLYVMDAEHLDSRINRSTWWWRNTSSPRCPIPKRRSTSSPAC